MHGEETLDLARVERLAESGAWLVRQAAVRQGRTAHKAHHERASSPEHIAPGHDSNSVHNCLPYALAARSTACRIRVWVPHRHR